MGDAYRREFDEARYLARYPDVQSLINKGLVTSGEEHWRTTDGPFLPFWWSPVRNRPVRAVFVTPSLDMGGAERWVALLTRLLNPDVVQCTAILMTGTVIHPELGAELSARLPLHAVRLATARGDFSVATVHENYPAACDAAFRDADVLIAWGLDDLSFISHGFHGRVVYCSHGTAPHAFRALDRAAVHASHLTAVSAAAAGRWLGTPQMTVIHNGIDLMRVREQDGREATRQTWGYSAVESGPHHSQKLIGYIGRLSAEKDPLAVVRAVAALPEQYQAVLIGSGELEAEYRARAELIAPGRVRFLGHLSDVGDALAALDVVVLASHTEAHSLTLCEAWAAGVPTVATPTGAIPELEKQFGPLTVRVPLDPTTHELATAIREAVQLRGTECIDRIRKLAIREFSGEYMALKWESYLSHICRTAEPVEPISIEPPVLDIPRYKPPSVDRLPDLPKDPVFYEFSYRQKYPHVVMDLTAGKYASGYEHWQAEGRVEGLEAEWVRLEELDTTEYLRLHPRIKVAHEKGRIHSPKMHFYRFGNPGGLEAAFRAKPC